MKKIIFGIASCVLLIHNAFACTLWGAVKQNEILVGKTRDYYPGYQEFKAVSQKKETDYSLPYKSEDKFYKFFGLYTEDHGKLVLKMGINEKGLTVLLAFASIIPKELRTAKHEYDKLMESILLHLASVDEIIKNSQSLFKESTPAYYVFADRQKALLCEIGLKHNYKCKEFSRAGLLSHSTPNIFAQTNHFIFKELKKYNLNSYVDSQSSYRRFDKIQELMKSHLSNLSLDQFIKFSLNTEAKNDDPAAYFDADYNNTYQDNSIFRTFNIQPDRKNRNEKNSALGMAAMIVELPRNEIDPIRLYLRKTIYVADSNNNNNAQDIKYEDAVVTLEDALNLSSDHPLSYQTRTCKRNRDTRKC